MGGACAQTTVARAGAIFPTMVVLGASFGATIMGAVSDYFANQAMLEAGATEMTTPFRAAGLHSAMYIIPALMLLCSLSLFGAARTVKADMQRLQAELAARTIRQP